MGARAVVEGGLEREVGATSDREGFSGRVWELAPEMEREST